MKHHHVVGYYHVAHPCEMNCSSMLPSGRCSSTSAPLASLPPPPTPRGPAPAPASGHRRRRRHGRDGRGRARGCRCRGPRRSKRPQSGCTVDA